MSHVASMHGAVEPAESPLTPESWGKLGMWIFLAGDAVGFGTLLAGYGAMRATSGDWPVPFDVLGINLTAAMTFLLICSSVTMVKALEWLGKGDRTRARVLLFLTALGGAIFVSLQAYEWSHLIGEGARLGRNPWGDASFGSYFFLLTGFHGTHVLTGVIILTSTAIRLSRSRSTAEGVEMAGLYWHFVDLVWVFIFALFYLV